MKTLEKIEEFPRDHCWMIASANDLSFNSSSNPVHICLRFEYLISKLLRPKHYKNPKDDKKVISASVTVNHVIKCRKIGYAWLLLSQII